MAVHPARDSLATRLTSAGRGLLLLVWGGVVGPAALQAQLLPSSADPAPKVERWNGNVRSRQGFPAPSGAPVTDLEVPMSRPATRANSEGKALLLLGDGERILPPLKPVEPILLTPPPVARPGSEPRNKPAPMTPSAPVTPTGPAAPPKVSPAMPPATLGDGCTWETLKNLAWLVKESTSSLRTCVEWFREQSPRPSAAVAFESATGTRSQGATSLGSLHPRTLETATALPRETPAAGAESPTQARVPHESGREMSWHQVFLLQLPGTIAALLGGPLVALALILVLRRSGVTCRVEMVNPPTYAVIGAGQQPVQALPAGNSPVDSALSAAGFEEPVPPPPEEEPSTGEAFDIGLTCEEERLVQQEAVVNQERAVLQQIFEDNCRLQQEIRQTSEAPAATAGAAEGNGT